MDSERSASPPSSHGTFFAIALIVLPDATRVASDSPVFHFGSSESQPAGSAPFAWVRHSSARSGYSFAKASKRRSHFVCSWIPFSTAVRKCRSDSSGMWNASSHSHPSAFFVSASSSAPSGLPCAALVPALCGEPWPMVVRTAMNVGRSSCETAVRIASSIAARSSFLFSTRRNCQP